MKHQRAALLHEAEEKKRLAARNANPEEGVEVEEIEEIEVSIFYFYSLCIVPLVKYSTDLAEIRQNIFLLGYRACANSRRQ